MKAITSSAGRAFTCHYMAFLPDVGVARVVGLGVAAAAPGCEPPESGSEDGGVRCLGWVACAPPRPPPPVFRQRCRESRTRTARVMKMSFVERDKVRS